MKILITIGVIAVIQLSLIAASCITLAWIHFPHGLLKAKKQKEKEESHEA